MLINAVHFGETSKKPIPHVAFCLKGCPEYFGLLHNWSKRKQVFLFLLYHHCFSLSVSIAAQGISASTESATQPKAVHLTDLWPADPSISDTNWPLVAPQAIHGRTTSLGSDTHSFSPLLVQFLQFSSYFGTSLPHPILAKASPASWIRWSLKGFWRATTDPDMPATFLTRILSFMCAICSSSSELWYSSLKITCCMPISHSTVTKFR